MTTNLYSRRQTLAALAALPLAAKPRYRPLVAAQSYVWTQQFSANKQTLAAGMEEMFAATLRAGYRRMELVSQFVAPENRARTAELARKHKFEIPIVYVGGAMHEAGAAEKTIAEVLAVADAARSLGAKIIAANPNPKPKREAKMDEELAVQARVVSRLCADLRQRGLELILHHHNPEMAANAREWRHLLKNTPAGICLDIDWVIRGGQAPLELLREAGGRLRSLHLRNGRKGLWTESLDVGEYDYPAVAALLRELGFDGYLVVELAHEKGMEIARPLEENLRRSRGYVEKVFGVK